MTEFHDMDLYIKRNMMWGRGYDSLYMDSVLYPAIFTGKTRNWRLAFCPLVILEFLLIGHSIWRFGVKPYKSCGS